MSDEHGSRGRPGGRQKKPFLKLHEDEINGQGTFRERGWRIDTCREKRYERSNQFIHQKTGTRKGGY